ncbi:MAG TPA: ferredoxin [Candidatus Nanoarchaeia archaeon]|nr:ferredoxin [Candidatus Nanoarchaeia archaeon]
MGETIQKKKMYKIVYDRPACIGAAACVAIHPKVWVMNADGKADLIGAKRISENEWELEVDADLEANVDAAQGCPVNVIHVYDKETGKKIV